MVIPTYKGVLFSKIGGFYSSFRKLQGVAELENLKKRMQHWRKYL